MPPLAFLHAHCINIQSHPLYKVLQCAVRCPCVQVYDGKHSRTVLHRVGILCNVLQRVVRCLYVQVHNGEHSRTVVHRVGLFNKTGHITTIISQSDVVRWLQQHQASLGALKGMTAHQLGWADKHIKSMPARTPAIEVQSHALLH